MALDFFDIYSLSSCILECHIKSSYRECGCVPWNYIHFSAEIATKTEKSGITEMCDFVGNDCFEKQMHLENMHHNCSCLPACQEVVYEVKHKVEEMDKTGFCAVGKFLWTPCSRNGQV